MRALPEHVRALLAPGMDKRNERENAALAKALMAIHACGDPDGLLPAAVRRGVVFAFDPQRVRPPAVAATNGLAVLFARMPARREEMGDFILAMVHELAHGVQVENGFLPSIWAREAVPADSVLVSVLMEAAATATAVDYGWKMYQKGDVRAMESLMDPAYAHVGAAWSYRSHVLQNGPWSVMDGSAKVAAVRGWFREEKMVAHYAGETCARIRREIVGVMGELRQKRDILARMLAENPGFHLAAHFLPGESLSAEGRLCRSLYETLAPQPGQPILLDALGGMKELEDFRGKLPSRMMEECGRDYHHARMALMAEEKRLRQEHHPVGPVPRFGRKS
ncbi:MAG: hypothetical protein A2018_00490 [Alphaproteobacteria bacterium GWF2_58_20]|nr:MAG: hypothetical protein A2018_00490 [Alphaproteobacteria bacterium GWF2_58_20]